MNKYRARKTRIGGVTYDSALEARYSLVLAERLRRREIKGYVAHVRYDLTVNGILVGRYTPDFVVTLPDGSQEVHEVKGRAARDWPLRRNVFVACYPHLPLFVNGARFILKGTAATPSKRRKRA